MLVPALVGTLISPVFSCLPSSRSLYVTRSHIIQAGLNRFSCLCLKCWDYRCRPLYPTSSRLSKITLLKTSTLSQVCWPMPAVSVKWAMSKGLLSSCPSDGISSLLLGLNHIQSTTLVDPWPTSRIWLVKQSHTATPAPARQ